jgi:hypothetical protein
MDLEPQPLYGKIELPLQRIDKSHADIAKGSDIVGKDTNAHAH